MNNLNSNKWYYEFSSIDKKTNIETKYAILKPNRRIREDGELFFASETSRFAKAGVLPKAAWNTILSNGGGTISDSEREQYGKLLVEYRDLSFELQSLLIKGENDRNDTENARVDALILEIDDIRKKIQAFEVEQINIFENTAESKARNRTILWWVLQLAHIEKDGKFKSFFSGETFNEKLDSYDMIEEAISDEDGSSIIRRFTYLITLWFLGRIETEDDFKKFDLNFLGTSEIAESETKSEETKSEETKSEETKSEETKTEEVAGQ